MRCSMCSRKRCSRSSIIFWTARRIRHRRRRDLDFSDLKNALKDICDDFDHSLIYEKGSLKGATIAALQAEEFRMIEVGFRPTAEHFSKYFYELMSAEGFPIHRVEVYETPNNVAAYEG